MIEVKNLVKAFGAKLAVNDISFAVERGEVLGFLGPNGAGKSTTMRMITGFIPPSDGTITVGGHDITTDPISAKRLIGYLPENAPVYADMSVQGFLSFCAELSGLRGDSRKKAVTRSWKCASSNPCCFRASTRYRKVTGIAPVSRKRSFMTLTCWCWTSRPTDWTQIKSTRSAD